MTEPDLFIKVHCFFFFWYIFLFCLDHLCLEKVFHCRVAFCSHSTTGPSSVAYYRLQHRERSCDGRCPMERFPPAHATLLVQIIRIIPTLVSISVVILPSNKRKKKSFRGESGRFHPS